jgi:O-antigen ligase
MAFVAWIASRPSKIIWPSYFVPLIAFMAATTLSLLMSSQPEAGMAAVRKFVLFSMGFLAANLVTTPKRARISLQVLLVVAAAASAVALVQFGIGYVRFLSTQALQDDPTVLARITGFMGHWMTFSGELLLVWCAAVPAIVVLGRRWMIPVGIIGTGLVFSFTRSVWLGAIGSFIVIALLMPRKSLVKVALPIALVAAAASGLIYHRLAFSFQEEQFAPDSARIELFIGGVRMIQDHPLFGVGPERIHTEFPRYHRTNSQLPDYYGHLENNMLQLAAERGLLCLGAFLWFVFELFASFWGMLRKGAGETRWIAVSALSALTGFVISGLFSYNFGDSEVLLLLLFILSMPYAVNHEDTETQERIRN